MRISACSSCRNDDVTLWVLIDAARATRAQGVAGLQQTAALP